ncbi:hypothetical protein GWK47_033403 [Chionoecetes opilio]|uniref:Uncharacterized protein n=1 Tax=Chionoecetes opilio TaxID=41210 RepID=A0A8J4YVE7_CHIOP|nr:hypothetical protein GWK47_033403 [Chionoecetes opilio]
MVSAEGTFGRVIHPFFSKLITGEKAGARYDPETNRRGISKWTRGRETWGAYPWEKRRGSIYDHLAGRSLLDPPLPRVIPSHGGPIDSTAFLTRTTCSQGAEASVAKSPSQLFSNHLQPDKPAKKLLPCYPPVTNPPGACFPATPEINPHQHHATVFTIVRVFCVLPPPAPGAPTTLPKTQGIPAPNSAQDLVVMLNRAPGRFFPPQPPPHIPFIAEFRKPPLSRARWGLSSGPAHGVPVPRVPLTLTSYKYPACFATCHFLPPALLQPAIFPSPALLKPCQLRYPACVENLPVTCYPPVLKPAVFPATLPVLKPAILPAPCLVETRPYLLPACVETLQTCYPACVETLPVYLPPCLFFATSQLPLPCLGLQTCQLPAPCLCCNLPFPYPPFGCNLPVTCYPPVLNLPVFPCYPPFATCQLPATCRFAPPSLPVPSLFLRCQFPCPRLFFATCQLTCYPPFYLSASLLSIVGET